MSNIKNKKFALAASAAMLISGCSSDKPAEKVVNSNTTDMGQCHGINSCKGSGSCATQQNSCAGDNSCRGKGWLPLSQKDCIAREGKFIGFKKQ